MANIINDGFLSVGGAGIGAVMGSKNLKAIAVRGSHLVTVADGNRFVQAVMLFPAPGPSWKRLPLEK